MRFSLFTLFLGTFLLTGCADDLTGPETNSISAEHLETNDLASDRSTEDYAGPIEIDAMLFASWVGADEGYVFELDFMEVPTATDIFEAPSNLRFGGAGTYKSLDSAQPCRIVDGVYGEGLISFDIVGKNGLVATAAGRVATDYASFKVEVKYDDGSVKTIAFERAGESTGTLITK